MAGRRRVELTGSGSAIDFALGLRELRDRQGLTLRELAVKSGYSQASLSAAESGRRRPSWDLVAAFVQSCGDDPLPWRARWELVGPSSSEPEAEAEAQDSQPLAPQDAPAAATTVMTTVPTAPMAAQPSITHRRRIVPLLLAALTGACLLGGVQWALAGNGTTPVALQRADDTYGCVGSDAPRTVALDPDDDPRQAGWQSSLPVPWGAPQCRNQIWWTPYSNNGAVADRHFSWTFAVATRGRVVCALWAYFPPPPAGHLGGTAHYTIQDGIGASARRLAYLAVAQADHRATWYLLGAFTTDTGYVEVTLDNSGSDTNLHHGPAAGPIHISCH